MSDGRAQVKTGTLVDRIANRIVRYFPGPRRKVAFSRPIVSFTFDDVPENARTHGATMLEAIGARGTFYIAGGLVGTVERDRKLISLDGCMDLARRGHELGCHTYSHNKLSRYTTAGLQMDLERNAAFLAECDGKTGRRNFAVPYTMSWPPTQAEFQRRFRSCRSGLYGINRGTIALYNLASVALGSGGPSLEAIEILLDELVEEPGWLIFYTHDVSANPTRFGYRYDEFSRLIEMVAARDCAISTVDEAITALGL